MGKIETNRNKPLVGTDREYEATASTSIELKDSVGSFDVTAFGATRHKAIMNCKIALGFLADRVEEASGISNE